MQSSSRPLQYREDLPVFKSHENMGRVNVAKTPVAGGYSLEAQQNFYQKYSQFRTNNDVQRRP